MGLRPKTYGFTAANLLSTKYETNKHMISRPLYAIRKDSIIIGIMFSKKSDYAKAKTGDTYRGKLYTLSKRIE